MSILGDAARALLGLSTYQKPSGYGASLSDEAVQAIRKAVGGGRLTPPTQTQTSWYLADLETAQHEADQGNLERAAKLCASMRTDGTIAGLLRTLTSGLVGLPKRFYGDEKLCADLRPRNDTRSDFDDLCPPGELAAFAGDFAQLGVAVAELLPVEGRDFPVFCRLKPEFLSYRQSEDRWYFRSIAGLLPITPGDGRWVLATASRVDPWQFGLWKALGRSFINKEHAMLHRSNFSAKLANPARVGTSPLGASEGERVGFFSRLAAWGINSVFDLPAGWDIKLLESNGRGWEVFKDETLQSDQEIMITIAGQIVTTTGGAGFSNSDVQRLIRADILKDLGDCLAHCVNTQVLPSYVVAKKGPGVTLKDLRTGAIVEWLTKAPKDLEAEARTMNAVGAGIKAVNEALRHEKKVVASKEVMTRFDLPVREATPEELASLTVADPDIKGGSASEIHGDATPKSDGPADPNPPATRRDDRPRDDEDDD